MHACMRTCKAHSSFFVITFCQVIGQEHAGSTRYPLPYSKKPLKASTAQQLATSDLFKSVSHPHISKLTCMDLTLEVVFLWVSASSDVNSWLIPSFHRFTNGGNKLDKIRVVLGELFVPINNLIVIMLQEKRYR